MTWKASIAELQQTIAAQQTTIATQQSSITALQTQLASATPSTRIVRVAKFHTYDNAGGGWMANNTASLFGGANPSNLTDGNYLASNLSFNAGDFKSLFGEARGVGKDALISAEIYTAYSSTDGLVSFAMLRVKNNTGSPINWTPSCYLTCYPGWNEYAEISLNGASSWKSTNTMNVNSTASATLSIPASRTSTVVVGSTSGNPQSIGATGLYLRGHILSFYNSCLNLPAGLELVDDLYSLPDTYNLKTG